MKINAGVSRDFLMSCWNFDYKQSCMFKIISHKIFFCLNNFFFKTTPQQPGKLSKKCACLFIVKKLVKLTFIKKYGGCEQDNVKSQSVFNLYSRWFNFRWIYLTFSTFVHNYLFTWESFYYRYGDEVHFMVGALLFLVFGKKVLTGKTF